MTVEGDNAEAVGAGDEVGVKGSAAQAGVAPIRVVANQLVAEPGFLGRDEGVGGVTEFQETGAARRELMVMVES